MLLFRSDLGYYIAEISWVQLSCNIEDMIFKQTSRSSGSYKSLHPLSLMFPESLMQELCCGYISWGWTPHNCSLHYGQL